VPIHLIPAAQVSVAGSPYEDRPHTADQPMRRSRKRAGAASVRGLRSAPRTDSLLSHGSAFALSCSRTGSSSPGEVNWLFFG